MIWRTQNGRIFWGALLILIIIFMISVATGYVSLSPIQLLRTLFGQGTAREELILFTFRLPRIMVTVLAGMGLAISGALLQSVTKNPLADPGILGINAGAGLMVVVYVMFFTGESTSFLYLLPLFALFGGLITSSLIYSLSFKRAEGIDPTRIVLIGVGIAAACNGAMTGSLYLLYSLGFFYYSLGYIGNQMS